MEQATLDAVMHGLYRDCALSLDLFIQMCDGQYEELFDRQALEALKGKIGDRGSTSEEEFRVRYNIARDPRDALSDGSIQKLQRDIEKFMELPHTGDTGRHAVSYHYKFGYQLGRRYASSCSFQNITGQLRKLLAAKFYWDIDFENSYPTILFHLSTQRGLAEAGIPVMARYLHDREACLHEIMAFYEVTRDAAKNCFIAHCHGGGMDGREKKGWMNEWGVGDDVRIKVSRQGHLKLVGDFKVECNRICEFLLGQYPEFKDLICQVNQRLPANEQKVGRMGHFSALSWLMATLEDGLLRHLETFLTSKGYQVDSLEFDGLKPRRNGDTGAFPEPILRDAEAYLAAQTLRGGVHIPMKLAEKPLRCGYEL
jgi:hypothetical protein